MDANEKYIINKLADSAENVEVPKSLETENVRALLENAENSAGQVANEADSEIPAVSNRKRIKVWSSKTRWATSAVAACLVIICGLGIFATGLSVNPSQAPSNNPINEDTQVSAIPVAKSYDELYDILTETDGSSAESAYIPISRMTGEAPNARESETEKGARLDATESSSFSKTNLRTEGVDEADVVKTDGSVIYTLQDFGNRLELIKTTNGKMDKAATIKTKDISKEASEFCEFFIENDRLYLIATIYNEESSWNPITKLITYDVSDPNTPKEIGVVDQTGYYNSARMVNGYLYLFTNYHPKHNSKKNKPGNYVPLIENSTLACEDIFIPSCANGSDYLVVSSIDTNDPNKLHQTKAVLAGASNVYVSNNSIYLYGPKYIPTAELARGNNSELLDTGDKDIALISDTTSPFSDNLTVICKLSYNDGSFDPVGETTVDGLVDDGFSIDEYQGNTRVITTSYENSGKTSNTDETSNNLYVLNEKLEQIGSLTNIAPDEQVYSARLMGDIGYFVTYKQVDPLFSVDLSDPTKPKIIGQLKIPGFSEYLHPWGDGLLLGIGQATDKSGEMSDGIKLSMFDVSDPFDVTELNTYVIKNKYWANVLYNYKDLYLNEEKGLFGFSAEGATRESYYLFSYSEDKGFSNIFKVKTSQWYDFGGTRGVSINDVFYIVSQGFINSYNMNNYKLIDSIRS